MKQQQQQQKHLLQFCSSKSEKTLGHDYLSHRRLSIAVT